jgi:hypothetical protein
MPDVSKKTDAGDVLSEETIAEILADLNYEVHRDVADEFKRARTRLAETLRAFALHLTDAEDALREIRSVETWTWAEANEIIDAHFAKYESEESDE